MKKVNWLSVFVYISIAFLIYYLYKNDMLVMPNIKSHTYLVISIIILFAGYFTNAYTWFFFLKNAGVKAKFKDALISIGLAVFGKYMPGKFWVVVGRAAFISERSGTGVKKLSVLSLNVQFTMLWVGLILGTLGLFLVGGFSKYGYICLAGIAVLALLVFTSVFDRIIEILAEKFLKRSVEIPKLDFTAVLKSLPYFFLHWLTWSAAFYFFALALVDHDIAFSVGLSFPLAATVGIMAVIAPGGIGIREGIIVAYLTMAGLTVQEATGISIASRIWFLIGEVYVFLQAAYLKQKSPAANSEA